MNEKLENCPCCKSENVSVKYVYRCDSGCSYKAAYIACEECGIRTPEFIIDGYCGVKASEDDAVLIWNRRE